jgi:Ni,Fe-hydrogenase III component G
MDAQRPLSEAGVLDLQDISQRAVSILQKFSHLYNYVESNRLDVFIERAHLKPAIQAILAAKWGLLSAITGLDHPGQPDGNTILETKDRLEVLYHFCQKSVIVTLRVSLPYADAVLPSICDLIPVATLYERELTEMFGVEVENTPDPSRLLLPDDWPDGIYPLRKSFKGLENLVETTGN